MRECSLLAIRRIVSALARMEWTCRSGQKTEQTGPVVGHTRSQRLVAPVRAKKRKKIIFSK